MSPFEDTKTFADTDMLGAIESRKGIIPLSVFAQLQITMPHVPAFTSNGAELAFGPCEHP